MTTARDVAQLRASTSRAVELAQADLAAFFSTWNLSNPALVRDGLLEIVPIIVREYGDLAATAAAEWYERVRAEEVGGSYYARPGALPDEARVQGSVRWAADSLFGDNPTHTLELLNGSIQRYISYGARDTIAREARLDPRKPRAARIPSGAKTCAWCLMLASRGWVYHTKESAGDTGRGVGDDFHDECNCQIVMSFDRMAEHIAGYDPDALYGMYKAAWEAAGGYGATDRAVASKLRRMFPEHVTDEVHEH